MGRKKSVSEFFYLSKVSESGCWLWSKYRNNGGYGVLSWNGKKYKTHRLSWKLYFGEIPDGLNVLHACDTPACINPHHLFLGTQEENVKDCAIKGRIVSSPRFGEENPMTKFSDEQVRRLRRLYADGIRQHNLADIFGMSRMTVSRIVRRELRKEAGI